MDNRERDEFHFKLAMLNVAVMTVAFLAALAGLLDGTRALIIMVIAALLALYGLSQSLIG
jgi:hypothetical protein